MGLLIDLKNEKRFKPGRQKQRKYLKRYWQLYLLLLIPIAYFLLFKYCPMYGIIIAFKEYNIFQGVFKSPWVGLDVFKEVFRTQEFYTAFRNTFVLNFLDLLFSFPAPIILAIIINELKSKVYKRSIQTVLYLPHFLSWVIIAGMSFQLFASRGIVNNIILKMGGEAIPFLTEKNDWLVVYLTSGVWQSMGWGTIIYLAAMAGINSELYEAAIVDGANRFRRIWHITLPGIKPTIVILLILALGKIPEIGFERPYSMGNAFVRDYSEVLSTYVYRVGLQSSRFNVATAVGLFQSIIGVTFLSLTNFIANKLGEEGVW